MEKENANKKFITILNFECKKCGTKIGQLVSNGINEDEIKCPNCGSIDISYGTLLK